MADEDNDEVIVSLPGDTSSVQITKVEPEKKIVPAGDDDPVADLKGQFAALQSRVSVAESAAQQATQQATQAEQRAQHMEGQVVSSQLDTVLSGLAAAEAETAAAEQALVMAIEAGDAAAQARAQRAIASATSRLDRLSEAKADLEDTIKTRPKPGAQPSQRRAPADPVEGFIQDNGLTPKAAAWVRSNPAAITDPKLNKRMFAAHNNAVLNDVELESPEYFKMLDDAVKPAVEKKADPAPKIVDGRRPSSAAASGAGAGGGGLNGGGLEVRLTKREAAAAVDGTIPWNYDDPTGQNRWKKGDPIGLAEMARRKHEGQKAGLYDRNNMEA